MMLARNDHQFGISRPINQPVHIVYAPGSITGQIAAQWFGFPYLFKRISRSFVDKLIDPLLGLFVLPLPVEV